jgi:hypothetical protein
LTSGELQAIHFVIFAFSCGQNSGNFVQFAPNTFSIGNRQSAIGNRQSAIGNRQSAIGNRQSAIGNRQSAIGNSPFSPVTFPPVRASGPE